MSLHHPFEWLPVSIQKRAFLPLAAAAIVLMIALQILGGPLAERVSGGIIAYELAGDLTTAQNILRAWGSAGQVYAGLQLGLDYTFIVAYTSAIALGCALVARAFHRKRSPFARLGVWLAWALFLAGLLDAIENYALIQLLVGSQDPLLPLIARWCAIPKFAIVGAGLVYVLAAGAVVIITNTSHPRLSANLR